MKEILEELGYEERLQLNKSRILIKYKDYQVCLDTVEGLGNFIEVEKISAENSKVVQHELHDFLKQLGVPEDQFESHPYDELVLRKSR